MTAENDAHREAIRTAFTNQAETYSTSERISDPVGRQAFLDFVAPDPSACVLDVATGPGFMAFAFSPRVASVLGVDLTPAMVERAQAESSRLSLANVHFQEGDVEGLPFADATFDITTCGSAFHHFLNPHRVLTEMVRVLRPGGLVAISDITTSEDPIKAKLHNRIENLRDPSHTRSLSVSELVQLGAGCGLIAPRTLTSRRERWLSEWVAISKTPPETVEVVGSLMTGAEAGDAAGIGVWLQDGEPHFWHTHVYYMASKAGQ
jgi:ubiquinone/menaquinone biosynthesis C-methylase UbiE